MLSEWSLSMPTKVSPFIHSSWLYNRSLLCTIQVIDTGMPAWTVVLCGSEMILGSVNDECNFEIAHFIHTLTDDWNNSSFYSCSEKKASDHTGSIDITQLKCCLASAPFLNFIPRSNMAIAFKIFVHDDMRRNQTIFGNACPCQPFIVGNIFWHIQLQIRLFYVTSI